MASEVHGKWEVHPGAISSGTTPSIEFNIEKSSCTSIKWEDKQHRHNNLSINGLGMVTSDPYPVNAHFIDGSGQQIATAYAKQFSVRKGCKCIIELQVGLLTLERKVSGE